MVTVVSWRNVGMRAGRMLIFCLLAECLVKRIFPCSVFTKCCDSGVWAGFSKVMHFFYATFPLVLVVVPVVLFVGK